MEYINSIIHYVAAIYLMFLSLIFVVGGSNIPSRLIGLMGFIAGLAQLVVKFI